MGNYVLHCHGNQSFVTKRVDDAGTGQPQAHGNNFKHTYGLTHNYTQMCAQLYKWVEQLFYEKKGEYFMSYGAKFRLQLQDSFKWLIIVNPNSTVCFRQQTSDRQWQQDFLLIFPINIFKLASTDIFMTEKGYTAKIKYLQLGAVWTGYIPYDQPPHSAAQTNQPSFVKFLLLPIPLTSLLLSCGLWNI